MRVIYSVFHAITIGLRSDNRFDHGCLISSTHWRVEGTSSLLAPHSLTIYAGADITSRIVVAAFVPVDNLGDWKMPKNAGPCFSPISIESSTGVVRIEDITFK